MSQMGQQRRFGPIRRKKAAEVVSPASAETHPSPGNRYRAFEQDRRQIAARLPEAPLVGMVVDVLNQLKVAA
jgi:hypothetical protein